MVKYFNYYMISTIVIIIVELIYNISIVSVNIYITDNCDLKFSNY